MAIVRMLPKQQTNVNQLKFNISNEVLFKSTKAIVIAQKNSSNGMIKYRIV